MVTDAKRRNRSETYAMEKSLKRLNVREMVMQMINAITTGSDCNKMMMMMIM
jgi:hypothetical protein